MRREVVRQAGRILGRLFLYTRESSSGLCFDCADRLAIEIEHIVCNPETGFHREFTHGNAPAGGQIDLIAILDEPTSSFQVGIDLSTRFLLRGLTHPCPFCCDDLRRV